MSMIIASDSLKMLDFMFYGALMGWDYWNLLLCEQSRYVRDVPDNKRTSRLLLAQHNHSKRFKLRKSNFSALFPLMSKCVRFCAKKKTLSICVIVVIWALEFYMIIKIELWIHIASSLMKLTTWSLMICIFKG